MVRCCTPVAGREPDTLPDPILNPVRAVAGSDGKATPAKPVEPVCTIPANATLTQSTAFSALVGRIPVGGQVQDPMPFKVLIGTDNPPPTVTRSRASKEWSCRASPSATGRCRARGTIQSATFVFDDGRVQTFGGTSRGSGQGANRQQEGLGWISDRFGVPCISGERITNAPTFLAQRDRRHGTDRGRGGRRRIADHEHGQQRGHGEYHRHR